MLYARKYYLWNRAFNRWRNSGISTRCPNPPTTKAVALDEWRLATKEGIEYFENECFNNNDGDYVDRLLYPYYKNEDLKASKKRKNKKC